MDKNGIEYKSLIKTNFEKVKKSLILQNYHYATDYLIDCMENILGLYAVNKKDRNLEGMTMLEIVRMKPYERPFFVDSELFKRIEEMLTSKDNAKKTKEDFEVIFSFLISVKTQSETDGFSFEITDIELLEIRNMLDD